MGKEDVAEVLQWMDFAMGTNANFVFSDKAPVTLKSVLARLQQIKAESDLYKNEVDRYKVATASAKIRAESDKNEIDRYKRELEAVNAKYNATRVELDGFKSEKDKTIAVFKDVITLKNAKIRELEVELGKVRVESTIYQNELNSKIAELTGVVAAQEKISELENKNNSLIKSFEVLGEIKNEEIFDTTIRARFTEISKLSAEKVYSPSIRFAGAQWKIHVCKKGDQLEFFVNGKKNNDDKWSCSVFYDFQLISHKSEKIIHSRGGGHAVTHTKNTSNWGFVFISFKDLFDEDKEYVKDDSILVAVVLKAFPSSPSN